MKKYAINIVEFFTASPKVFWKAFKNKDTRHLAWKFLWAKTVRVSILIGTAPFTVPLFVLCAIADGLNALLSATVNRLIDTRLGKIIDANYDSINEIEYEIDKI